MGLAGLLKPEDAGADLPDDVVQGVGIAVDPFGGGGDAADLRRNVWQRVNGASVAFMARQQEILANVGVYPRRSS